MLCSIAFGTKTRYSAIMHCTIRVTSRLQAIMTPDKWLLLQQFARFGTVGAAGAVVDVTTVYASMGTFGLYVSGLLAYLMAVTTTWALNRAWTFAGRGSGGPLQQWLRFVAANGVGFVLNRGTFFTLVTVIPACAQSPVIAILAGMSAGMFANFNLSRTLVFHGPRTPVQMPE